MNWSAPKTNWSAASVPLPVDFNRIENNALYLKQTMQGVFGERTLQGLSASSPNNVKICQKRNISIPNGKTVSVVDMDYAGSETNIQRHVSVMDGATVLGTWYQGQDGGNTVYTNNTGSTLNVQIAFRLVNPSGSDAEVTADSSWVFTYQIE